MVENKSNSESIEDQIKNDEKFWFDIVEKNSNFKVNRDESKLLQDGINKVILIQTSDKKIILRVSSLNKGIPLTKDDYYYELEVLSYLHKNQFPVAYPFKWKNGTYLLELEKNSEKKYAILISFAEGKSILPFSSQNQFDIGKSVAEMHNLLLKFESNYKRIKWDIDNGINRPVDEFKIILGKTYNFEANKLEEIRSWLIKKLDNFEKESISIGKVHGDIHNLNIYFTDDGKHKIFDFDLLAESYLAFDIACFIGSEQVYASIEKIRENFPKDYKNFISGYTSVRKLTNEEIKLLPFLEVMRWLIIFGAYSQLIKHRGKEVIAGQTLEYWISRNMKYYLYRVIDLIEKLESENFDYLSYTRFYEESEVLDYYKNVKNS